MDRYAVAGHPISHSRSPFIHRLFAAQTGQALSYDALDVPAGDFTIAVTAFRDAGGRGMNLTLPLKELACGFADVRSDRAALAGAANTLHFREDGRVYADNTDGLGLIRDLTVNLGVSLAGRRILLIGAGGAARGVLAPLLDEMPQRLIIANRTRARAEQLCSEFHRGAILASIALEEIGQGQFDVVINATSASLQGESLPIGERTFATGACCYDMLYSKQPTAFLKLAGELAEVRGCDGRGMLVEQAAEAFKIWRGMRPLTGPVITALSRLLAEGNAR